MLYTLSRNSTEIVQCLSCTTEDVRHQTLLVQKSRENLTPLHASIRAVISVGCRNIGASSGRIWIAWYCDNCTTLEVWLTRTTSCDAVLSKAEGDTPEVVREVDVVVLEAELTVRRVWSNTSTPEIRARRTENWHLGWVQRSISQINLACLESVELPGLIRVYLILNLVSRWTRDRKLGRRRTRRRNRISANWKQYCHRQSQSENC